MSNDVPSVTGPLQPASRERIARVPAEGGYGQLGAGAATLYTAPSVPVSPTGAVATAALMNITLCNTDASARTVTLYIVESGGSAAANRALVSGASMAAGETWILEWGQFGVPMNDGATIQGLASSASKVTYRISVDQLVPLT